MWLILSASWVPQRQKRETQVISMIQEKTAPNSWYKRDITRLKTQERHYKARMSITITTISNEIATHPKLFQICNKFFSPFLGKTITISGFLPSSSSTPIFLASFLGSFGSFRGIFYRSVLSLGQHTFFFLAAIFSEAALLLWFLFFKEASLMDLHCT